MTDKDKTSPIGQKMAIAIEWSVSEAPNFFKRGGGAWVLFYSVVFF